MHVQPLSPCSENVWLRACTQALFFCKTLHPKFLTVSWTRLCLDNCSVIFTGNLCYGLHQTHSEFWHIQAIFPHIEALSRHIQIYPGIFTTLSDLRIINLAIFWAFVYLEPEAYSKPYETLASQIHDSAIVRTVLSGIFKILTIEYVEIWHVRNSGIFKTLPQLHPGTYSERCHIYENRQAYVTLEIQKP